MAPNTKHETATRTTLAAPRSAQHPIEDHRRSIGGCVQCELDRVATPMAGPTPALPDPPRRRRRLRSILRRLSNHPGSTTAPGRHALESLQPRVQDARG